MGLSAISLFSGAGGLDLAARWAGIRTVCYVEIDRYAQGVLMSRIRGGALDDAPIWSDVSTFDGKSWRGRVDCIFGGFPCQDLSFAGSICTGRKGIQEGTRSGLWLHFARIIREVGPKFIIVENVAGLLAGGLGIVLGDLAELGFDARWEVLRASQFGANHQRPRVFIFAYPRGQRRIGLDEIKKIISPGINIEGLNAWRDIPGDLRLSVGFDSNSPKRGIIRMDDGLAEGMDRLRLTGNGVVWQQASASFGRLKQMSEMSVSAA